MYLSDHEIAQAVESAAITLSDFDLARLQPTSYDILLGHKFLTVDTHRTGFIDPVRKILPEYREIIVSDDEEFILHPGVSILGTSLDYFGSDEYLIQLSGKSSLARIGLVVHNTAGVINPGHYLHITFELTNLNSVPIILRPRMAIAQLLFSKISSPPQRAYRDTGRYHDKNWAGYIEERRGE